MTQQESQYDMVIIGAGLAGLCLHQQIHQVRPETRILILEKAALPYPRQAHKVGEATVELGAHYLAKTLNLEAHFQDKHLPKYGLRFYFSNQGETLDEGMELGLQTPYETPSYLIDRGLLENHLIDLVNQAGSECISEARVKDVQLSEQGPHRISYRKNEEEHSVSARWVVDASGRHGLLRRQQDLNDPLSHQANAVWFRINTPLKTDDWQPLPIKITKPGVHRWLSVNHLMGQGYWVWIIALPGGATSVGIVADPRFHELANLKSFDRTMEWFKQHEPSCFKAIDPYRNQLMDFKVLRNFSHGCKQLFSANRWAVVGEAGPFLDPFYSPGSDFIAIGNTFLTNMVLRDLRGRPIAGQTQIYNQLFFQIFGNTLRIYQDQYQVFGNPLVMPLKVMWDYAVYWSFTAFLGIQGYLADLTLYEKIRDTADTIGKLNAQMQAFFRKWHLEGSPKAQSIFVDQCSLPLLRKLNNQLTVPVPKEDIPQRMNDHLQNLRNLSAEMVRAAALKNEALLTFMPSQAQQTQHLRDVLAALHGETLTSSVQ